MSMDRREFVRAVALVGTGVAVSGALVAKDRWAKPPSDPTGDATIRTLPTMENIPQSEGEDVLIRMQRELARAMAKPVEQRNWVMVIDTRKCVGCDACTIGCIAENKLPPGVVYRPVVKEELGAYPNVKIRNTPRPCMQCEKPPCVPVCPVKATWRRPDGITGVDYDKCIGCRYCLEACPYGARTSDFGLHYADGTVEGAPEGDNRPLAAAETAMYEQLPNNEYAKHWKREGHESPIGNARKCHFCLHRLEVGQLPTCTTTCIGRATYFGDQNAPESLVSELIAHNNVQTLLPHKRTNPRVFYVV
jgi:molybdopterin-containing oxidoreductase family iron-sulfur binding subunit